MKGKMLTSTVLLLLLTVALTAAAVLLFVAFPWQLPFWVDLLVSVPLLVVGGMMHLRVIRRAANSDVADLNRQLAEKGEKLAFSRPPVTASPEMKNLWKQVRGLCSQLTTSRQKRRNQKRQFDFILANMNEGFLLTDTDQRIVTLNGSAARILGLHGEMVGKELKDAVEDPDILRAVAQAVEKNKKTVLDLQSANGSTYALNVRLVRKASLSEHGMVMLALFDVTAERIALKQRQDFFSNASHELKTPITSISGFAELLEAGLITDPQKAMDSVKIIRREANRMTRIINDLLLISQLENDEDLAEKAPVDIGQLLGEIREAMQPAALEKNLTMEISGGAFSVLAVPAHMHNLFENLIQNAVKYNVEQGSVFVRAERDDKHLYLTVKDTGIGIPEDMQARVFERFFRVDKGRSKSVGGTGLGLAIVKHIVSLYDGTISLKSAPGKGTTIQVRLKIEKV